MFKRIALAAVMAVAFAATAISPASAGVAPGYAYICHVPPGNPAEAQVLLVGIKAAGSHLANHAGDSLGFCQPR